MKFPVFSAFGASLAYITGHFLTLVKIMWLPLAIMMAAQVYFMPSILEAQMNMMEIEAEGDPSAVFAAMGPVMQATAIMYLIMAIAYPMMIAGTLKHVIRGEAPSMPFYLSYGLDELRVLGAFILLMIMTTLIAIAGVLGVMVLVLALSALGSVGAVLAGFIPLILMVAIIWFMLRMSVVYAAAIGEGKMGIAESWSLTQGRAWALFFFWALIVIVMLVLGLIYMAIAMSGYFQVIFEMIAAGQSDPAAAQELERRMMEMQANLFDISKPGSWLYIGATYFFTMIYMALWVVPSGVAYRYLSGQERG